MSFLSMRIYADIWHQGILHLGIEKAPYALEANNANILSTCLPDIEYIENRADSAR